MKKLTRREAVGGMIAAAAGAAAISGSVEAQSEKLRAAFAGLDQPKPLPFDAAKLNGISEKLIRSHHENNYAGAVKALNVVEQRLAALGREKDLPAYLYGDLKRQPCRLYCPFHVQGRRSMGCSGRGNCRLFPVLAPAAFLDRA